MRVLERRREAAALEFLEEPRREKNSVNVSNVHFEYFSFPFIYTGFSAQTLDHACLNQALAGEVANDVLATSCETSARHGVVVSPTPT